MSKRKLSKQQSRRIKDNQTKRRAQRSEEVAIDEGQLGPIQIGRVVAHYGTQVDVEAADSENTRQRCFLRANIQSVVTGDQVIFRSSEEGMGVVVSIEPRESELVRPDSYGKLKPVAANVNFMMVTIAPEPEPFLNLIDRYIVAGENSQVTPIILINKLDLLERKANSTIECIQSLYSELGYHVFSVCVKTRRGILELQQFLSGGTCIFVGQSGVGKSSIIQTLLPNEQIKIGALSEQMQKGKHTTTHSQLYHFDQGGSCIDSPGIREFGLWHLSQEEVLHGFKELDSLSRECRFRDCAHEQEPGCAIRMAIENKTVSSERFESYKRILNSLDDVTMRNTTIN